MADFTREQFADDVRRARLTILLRWTVIGGFIAIFLIVTAGMMSRWDIMPAAFPMVIIMAGTLLARALQPRVTYSAGARLYVLSLLAAVSVAVFAADGDGARIATFFFPLVVFIIGTLFPPSRTLLAALYTVGIVIAASIARPETFPFGWPSIGAMALSLGAAGIAALVTGDLYQIAEWAMFNYSRERRISGELFDSRVELERSLARSQALSDRLQETNVALDVARLSAEEAKHFRGQFLANMSHELRTPLNAIIGFSETMLKYPMMYDGVTLPSAYETDLSQIYTSGQELLKLINDILDLSKVDAGKLEIRVTPTKAASAHRKCHADGDRTGVQEAD
ncbi:MAG: hypothetical protein IPK19_16415 [Chloroflexi bacterium]|nr:hypothetical protein [Chloroflexota bacterium]